jgi:hypothetical protein
MNIIELRRPALLCLRLSPLTRFLHRLLVRLREISKVRIELGLQLGPDAVNDAANLFLGH